MGERPGQPEDGTERALLRRVRQGDVAAFGALVTGSMERLYYAALGFVGTHDEALDLSQDAFVRAFAARATIDPDRPWYPWIYQILRRLCLNHLRDRRTRGERLQARAAWLEPVPEALPDQAVLTGEVRNRVVNAIDALPVEQREVLVLKEYEHRSYREIAELLDIPIGTVMSRLYAARRKLAEALEDLR